MVKQAPISLNGGQKDELRIQFAALCWRRKRGKLQILLITSLETRRWILPKGWPKKGFDAEGTALDEAWEEAGIRPVGSGRGLIGRYRYTKRLPIDASGKMPDGTAINGPSGIRKYLLARPEQFTRCLTEKLFVYALGRQISFTDRDDIDRIVSAMPRHQHARHTPRPRLPVTSRRRMT